MTTDKPNIRLHIGTLRVGGTDAAGSRDLADALQDTLRNELAGKFGEMSGPRAVQLPHLRLTVDAAASAVQGRQIASGLQAAVITQTRRRGT